MNAQERSEIAQLRADLLGEDGTAMTEGVLYALRQEFKPALTFYQRASAVLSVARWLGPTGLVTGIIGFLWMAGAIK